MKINKLLLVLCFLSFSVSLSAQQVTATPANLSKLAWLTGTWERTNSLKPGRVQTETWKATANNLYGGSFVTVLNGDTTIAEKFSIVIKNNALFYVADVPDNSQPVYFKMVALADNGFVCENPSHDFPKKITYRYKGDNLTATITDGYRMVEFVFKKRTQP